MTEGGMRRTVFIATVAGALCIALAHTACAADLVWVGDGVFNYWDNGNSTNWLDGETPAAFNAGDSVLVDDTAGANPTLTLSGELHPASMTVNAAITITFSNDGDPANMIAGTAGLFKDGAGSLVMDSLHTYSGTTTVHQGTLEMTSDGVSYGDAISDVGTGVLVIESAGTVHWPATVLSAFGNYAPNPVRIYGGQMTVDGGYRYLTESGYYDGGQMNSSIEMTGGQIIGKGNLQFSGTVIVHASDSTALMSCGFGNSRFGVTTEGGLANPSVEFSGSLWDGGGVSSLAKDGPGTMLLSGTNTYSGATTITGGRLILGSERAIAKSGVIDVGSNCVLDVAGLAGPYVLNGRRLQGSGAVVGDVTSPTNGIVAVGTPGTADTLTFSNALTLSGCKILCDFAPSNTVGGGANDLIVVRGLLTLENITTIFPNFPNGCATGAYTLIRYYGGVAGDASNLRVLPGRYTGTINMSVPGEVRATFVDHGPGTQTWVGAENSSWDVGISVNWDRGAGVESTFSQGDRVVFDDEGLAHTNIQLVGNLAPTAVVVNSSGNYSFDGSGAGSQLTGTAGITIAGPGSLTMNSWNDYSGPTIVNNGTLVLNKSSWYSGSDIGSSTLIIMTNGTVYWPSGPYHVFDAGGNNPIRIYGGTFRMDGGGYVNPSFEMTGGRVIGSGGFNGWGGADPRGLIVHASDATAQWSARFSGAQWAVTVENGTADPDFEFSGSVAGDGSGITKDGPGSMVISGTNNTYTGMTYANGGLLIINNANAIRSSSGISTGPNGTCDVTRVAGGTYTLAGQSMGGSGVILGNVNAQSSGTIIPATIGTFGTVTFAGALSLASSFAMFDLSSVPTEAAGTNDEIVVDGDLTLAGVVTILPAFTAGKAATGQYTLIRYTGSLSGSEANLFVPPPFTAVFDVSAPHVIKATLTVPTVINLVWTGAGNAKWQVGGGLNWTSEGYPIIFSTGNRVLFDDSTTTNGVTLVGTVVPGATVVSSSFDYAFNDGGSGRIGGSGGLVKDGPGMLTLSILNDYSGTTLVQNGTLVLNHGSWYSGSDIGSSILYITTNGTAYWPNGAHHVFDAGGNNPIRIAGGTFTVDDGFYINPSLEYWGGTFNGGGRVGHWGGTTWNVTTHASGLPALFSCKHGWYDSANTSYNVTIGDGEADPDFILNGAWEGTGSSFIKKGAGTMRIDSANSFSGPVTINAGTLDLANNAALMNVTNIYLNTNAVLKGSAPGGYMLGHGQKLTGWGTVVGPFCVTNGGMLAPGSVNGAGTMHFSNGFSMIDGTLVLNFGADPAPGGLSNDLLVVDGDLLFDGSVNVAFSNTTHMLTNTPYTFIRYSGALTGGPMNLRADASRDPLFDFSVSGEVRVILGVIFPPTNIVWLGGQNGNAWDIRKSQNWFGGGTARAYRDGDIVEFGSAAGNNTNVNIAEVVQPGSLTFNSSASYILNNLNGFDPNPDQRISGATGLTKEGTGVLVMDAWNDYTGTTTVNNGSLKLTLGSFYNGSDIGTGPLCIGRSGTVVIAAANVFDRYPVDYNAIRINGGTLRMLAGTRMNPDIEITDGRIVGSAGSYMHFMNGNPVSFVVHPTMTSVYCSADIAWYADQSMQDTCSFYVADGPADPDFLMDGGITPVADWDPWMLSVTNGATLIKDGPGSMVVNGTSTYIGATTVMGGSLKITAGFMPMSETTNPVVVYPGARLEAGGLLYGALAVDGTLAPGASVGTLTVSNSARFGAGSTIEWEAGFLTSDVINVQNNLDIGAGIVTVRVAAVGPVDEMDVNPLFTFGTLAGGTNNLVLVQGQYATGGVFVVEANMIAVSNVYSGVPEPAAAGAVAVIGYWLFVYRIRFAPIRRRKEANRILDTDWSDNEQRITSNE